MSRIENKKKVCDESGRSYNKESEGKKNKKKKREKKKIYP